MTVDFRNLKIGEANPIGPVAHDVIPEGISDAEYARYLRAQSAERASEFDKVDLVTAEVLYASESDQIGPGLFSMVSPEPIKRYYVIYRVPEIHGSVSVPDIQRIASGGEISPSDKLLLSLHSECYSSPIGFGDQPAPYAGDQWLVNKNTGQLQKLVTPSPYTRGSARPAVSTVEAFEGSPTRPPRPSRPANSPHPRPPPGTARTCDTGFRPPQLKTYAPTGTSIENGYLPSNIIVAPDLNYSEDGEGMLLLNDIVEDYNNLSKAFSQKFGRKLPAGQGFRSYDYQCWLRQLKPTQAAYPGTSNHGWAVAVDWNTTDNNGIEGFGSETFRWMQSNAGRYNWVHPSWAQITGGLPEPWHWEHRTAKQLISD